MPGGGERARMGKMCLHGPWEIPPLFAITVTFQNSAVPPSFLLRSGGESSYYLITGSDSERCRGKIPLSERSICSNLKGRRKNQISITVLKISKAASLNWNSLLAFIQAEWRFKGKWSRTLTFAGIRGSFWSAGVPEEALLTVLAVAALCVVAAVVTHAAAPPSRCEPQSTTEVTALGMAVTLALWVKVDN